MNSIISESHPLEILQKNEDIIEKNLNLSLPVQTINDEIVPKSNSNLEINNDYDEINLNNSDTKVDIVPSTSLNEQSEIDGRYKPINLYTAKKNVAEGMMDIALLTANANQLRFLITYNYDSKTYYFNMILIIISLVLQICVGIALIFKRQMKNRGKLNKANRSKELLVVGVFLVTIINVFVAAFTTTDSITK